MVSSSLWIVCFVVLLFAGSASSQTAVAPRADLLLRISPSSEREVDALERRYPVVARSMSEDGRLELVLEVDRVAYEALVREGWAVELVDPDRLTVRDSPEPTRRVQQRSMTGYPCYRTVDETHADLQALASAHPDIAQWLDFGDSWEKVDNPQSGSDLGVLVLGNTAVQDKPALVVSAAMHARELTTAEAATRFAERLVAGYQTDADLRLILDTVEVHIIAQLNPDGRRRVEAALPSGGDIWWRKNTNSTTCGTAGLEGVDLNRNSTFQWGSGSPSGCADTYRGLDAGSEPETMAIENYLLSVFDDQRGELLTDSAPLDSEGVFVSIHSYGEFVFLPWEWTNVQEAPNRTQLDTLGRKVGHLTGYTVCADCDAAFPVSGTNVDFAYGELGVAAYTFELGTTFHEPCDPFEETIVEPVIDSLIYLAKAARRPYQWPAGPDVIEPVLDRVSVSPGETVQLSAIADDTRYDGGQDPEPSQNIVAVYYTVDAYPWTTAGASSSASDGGFDSSIEAVEAEIDTTGLSLGRHTIYLVAEDASGAVGPPTAIDLMVGLFADDFESGDTTAWSP